MEAARERDRLAGWIEQTGAAIETRRGELGRGAAPLWEVDPERRESGRSRYWRPWWDAAASFGARLVVIDPASVACAGGCPRATARRCGRSFWPSPRRPRRWARAR